MAKDEQYFSWDNFDEIVELDKHFSFICDMFDKYGWEENTKEQLVKQFGVIKGKQKKNKIIISVVGEASTGKSSFINAILKVDLLVSGALHGTTVVPTVMEYAEDYRIEILKKNRETKEFLCDGIEELRDKTAMYTAMAESAKDVIKVFVRLPAQILADGFVIIDTPGINVEIQRNEVEHGKMLEEKSDAFIVITDINKALPQTLLQFVRAKLSDSLQKCFFVATKCDVIQNGKADNVDKKVIIEEVLDYIKRRLDGDFNLKDVMVLPYAAQEVIDDCNAEGNLQKELLDLSQKTENAIITVLLRTEFLQRKKEQLLQLGAFYDDMLAQMKNLSSEYEQQIKSFQELRKQTMMVYLNNLAQDYEKRYAEEAGKIIREAVDEMYAEGLQIIRSLTYEMESQTAETDNRPYGLLQETSSGVKKMYEIVSGMETFCQSVETLFAGALSEIREEIGKRFSDLNISMPMLSDGKSLDVALARIEAIQVPEGNEDLHSYLCKILDDVTRKMEEFISPYTDAKTGIFVKEIGKYDEAYSEKYDEAVEKWFLNKKRAEMNQWKDKKDIIDEDIIRVNNRKFSIDSVYIQLQRRMEKDGR